MSTAVVLPKSANPKTWNEDTQAILEFAGLTWKEGDKRGFAPQGVIGAFIAACNRTGLDPSAKQIYAAKMSGKWTVLVGIDGMRVIAQRSGEYEGQTPIQWTADGITWVDVWLSDTKPAAARVGIYRKGFREPLFQVVTWSEFGMEARYNGDNWGVRPAHMLGIRAESHALRKAFPNDLSGLYTPEDVEAGVIEPVEESKDWRGLVSKAQSSEVVKSIIQESRDLNELTDELRAFALAKYGELTRLEETPVEETPEPAQPETVEEIDPARDLDYEKAQAES